MNNHSRTVAILAFLLIALAACDLIKGSVSVVVTATKSVPTAVGALLTPSGPTPVFGPVIGPNYTPPPTFTQGPLISPTVPPTPTGPTPFFGPAVGGPGAASPMPSATVLPPTQASSVPIVPATLAPGQPTMSFGPVIGPNYTEPPSLTPVVLTQVSPANVTLPPPATAGPSPTPGPILRRDLMGIQIHGFLTTAEWDRMLDHVRTLGLGWLKVQVRWRDMEPDQKGTFSEQYRTLVLHLQRVSSPKIRVLVSIAKAPDWARPAGARGQEDGPPENPQDLADFLTSLIHDTSAGNIDAIEVWNEPNLIREWRGKALSGTEYMRLFDAAYRAIVEEQKRQVNQFRPDHRITVLTAGPAPTITSPNGDSMNDRDWLRQLYAVGLDKYGDDVGIGIHPYGWANPPDAVCCAAQPGVTGWYEHPSFYFRNTIDDYRKVILNTGDGNRKLWITEFGYATYDGLRRSDGNAARVDPGAAWESLINQDQQASYVLRAFHLAQQPPYYEFLGPFFLWNLNFATIPKMTDTGREEAGFSLLDQGGNPRPVYNLLQSAPKQ